jgi:uncharacterized protein (TIGR00255 family)
MTGFGEAEERTPLGWVRIEVKSLNHKFREFIFNLPAGYSSLEGYLKRRLKKIKRGRVSFSLQILPQVKRQVLIDRELLKSYLENIKELKKEFGLEQSPSLDTILNLPGLLHLVEDRKKKKNFASLNLLAKRAIENLLDSRRREGEAIYKELKERIKIIEELSESIKKRQKVFLEEKQSSFTKPEDWEVFLKNTDINEEIQRIDFHLKNFKKIARIKSRSIGKELDFISQELMREANTMTAKSPDREIIFNLIRIKTEIERIREQLQNVE